MWRGKGGRFRGKTGVSGVQCADSFKGGVVGSVRCHRRAARTYPSACRCDLPDVGKGWWQVQGGVREPLLGKPWGHGTVGGVAAGLIPNVCVCLTDSGA